MLYYQCQGYFLQDLCPREDGFTGSYANKKNKGLDHRQGAGSRRKIRPNDKRRISNILKSVPRIYVRQLTTQLESNVGKSTVHRYLKRHNFVNSPVIRLPALTDLQIQKRINWCKEMKGFDWSETLIYG